MIDSNTDSTFSSQGIVKLSIRLPLAQIKRWSGAHKGCFLTQSALPPSPSGTCAWSRNRLPISALYSSTCSLASLNMSRNLPVTPRALLPCCQRSEAVLIGKASDMDILKMVELCYSFFSPNPFLSTNIAFVLPIFNMLFLRD